MQAIYNHRELVGYAKDAKQAARMLRKILSIHPSMTLTVWERSADMADILGLPVGFVYSVAY